MNKFAAMLAGVAVLGMASCSNDEPMGPAGGDKVVTSDALYLAVNITSAEDFGKADTDDKETDAPTYSKGDEHVVNSARFFFFDEQGFFVTEANVWADGTDNKTDNANIEYDSSAMLVLEGLKGKNQPSYLFTVVNCPADFTPAATLRETAKKAVKFMDVDKFVMSTSSFFTEETGDDAKYDVAYPYANALREGDFHTEPLTLSKGVVTDKGGNKVAPLDIYVERLAAKVSMGMGIGFEPTQQIEVTVGGNPNGENNDDKGKTQLWITLTGLTVTNVESESYIAKNIDDFAGEQNAFNGALENWTSWNRPGDFRSFWGKSMLYGTDDALTAATFKDALNNGVINPVYTYETTTTLAKLIGEGNTSGRVNDSRTPCAVITAKISSDKDGNQPVELVLFQGLYYTKEHFKAYALSRLNATTGGLNFYYKDADNEYQQIGTAQVDYELVAETTTGNVKLVSKLEGVGTLYAKSAVTGAYESYGIGGQDQLDARLKSFTEGSKAEIYNGGNSYYVLPISHLRSNTVADRKANKASAEGQWGLVRNHWYQLEIGKISKLGHGVFDPDSETITTDRNDDDTYGMAAEIHTLSWRIVKQQVDL